MGLRLQRFCCCCSLKTGSLVIGTLGWIFTLLEIFGLADTSHYKKKDGAVPETQIAYKIFAGLLSLAICVLLIVGVYKRNRKFILPWLVMNGIQVAVTCIITIIVFVVIFLVDASLTVAFVVIFFILLLISILSVYFWLCVWSHYRDLGDEENELRTSPAAMKMTA